jgi:hypothetical protein
MIKKLRKIITVISFGGWMSGIYFYGGIVIWFFTTQMEPILPYLIIAYFAYSTYKRLEKDYNRY